MKLALLMPIAWRTRSWGYDIVDDYFDVYESVLRDR
jgi:hypothetical protein